MRSLLVFLLACAATASSVSASTKTEDADLYRKLFPRALMGDSAAQEDIAELLLTDRANSLNPRDNSKDLGMKFLYLAAVRGSPSAMQRLSVASKAGQFGLAKSGEAAGCWASAAIGQLSPLQCQRITKFTRWKVRPRCDEIALVDDPASIDAGAADRLVQSCVANGTPAILVPGGPPGKETLIRTREFERRGIEYIVTGDVGYEKFEAFRERFNSAMEREIIARFGPNIFSEVDAATRRAIKKAQRHK
jgi:hypothetical protein